MQSSLARFTVALSTFFMFTSSLPVHADTAARTASNAPFRSAIFSTIMPSAAP